MSEMMSRQGRTQVKPGVFVTTLRLNGSALDKLKITVRGAVVHLSLKEAFALREAIHDWLGRKASEEYVKEIQKAKE